MFLNITDLYLKLTVQGIRWQPPLAIASCEVLLQKNLKKKKNTCKDVSI